MSKHHHTALKLLFIIVVGIGLLLFPGGKIRHIGVNASGGGNAIKFNGTGANDLDRIKVPLDGQGGVSRVVDVGSDFTIEWWMNAPLVDNTATAGSCGVNDGWINGNIMVDRDVYGGGDYGDYGISLSSGRIIFGVSLGGNGTTACSGQSVADGQWHHVAAMRRASDGQLRIYIDGVLSGEATGPVGNVSYRDGRTTSWPNSDPYLVIGAEKHDAGSAYPSYRGWVDEFRVSNVVRYSSTFLRPNQPFLRDGNTVLLYHFDEGSGTGVIITDDSGNGITGDLHSGITWGASTVPFTVGTPTPAPTPVLPTPAATPTPTSIATPTVTPSLIPSSTPMIVIGNGDANNDGSVTVADLMFVLSQWLQNATGMGGPNQYGDTHVNALDWVTVLRNLPTATPLSSPSPQPSPTTLPVSPGEWTQLGGNPQRTGYSSSDIPAPWRIKWIWNGPGGVNGLADGGPAAGHLRLPKGIQPVTGEGKLYVGHDDGTIRAVSEATGQQAWSKLVGGRIVNTSVYDAGSVYVGSTNGSVFRLQASDGTVLASNDIGGVNGEIQMAPLVVGDTVYVGATNGNFYALNKTDLSQRWVYNAGAALLGSTAYSSQFNGLIILLAEDKSVHAIQANTGTRRWRVIVNADIDSYFSNQIFADSYPVVSDTNGVVIVRSHLLYSKMGYNNTPYGTVSEIRQFLQSDPTYKSMFVLNLDTGQEKFIAPVLYGGLGNGGMESVPPQAVVKRLSAGTEVAYLLWRTRDGAGAEDRSDTTIGEMNLATGNIRFVRDYKSQGTMRFPSDEQSPLSMAGSMLFHAHWLNLGAIKIGDRTIGGTTYANPIPSVELTPVMNTLASGSCAGRSNHYCPDVMYAPGETYPVDPGFYVYYYNQKVYDLFWQSPIRSAVIANGTIYWRSTDGAITALTTSP